MGYTYMAFTNIYYKLFVKWPYLNPYVQAILLGFWLLLFFSFLLQPNTAGFLLI